MIDFFVNYRATIFTETISATSDNVARLVSCFADKQLLPNIYNELVEGQTSFSSVLELKNIDGSFVIKFGLNRVDIFRIKQTPSMDIGSIEDFCKLSKDCLKKILDMFPQKISRVALFISGIFKEISSSNMKDIYSNIFNTTPFIDASSLVEWNTRQVMRINFNIGSLGEELVNFVLNLSKGELTLNNNGQINMSDRIIIEIDTNTYQHNKNERFGYDEVSAFWDKAVLFNRSKLAEVEEYIWMK